MNMKKTWSKKPLAFWIRNRFASPQQFGSGEHGFSTFIETEEGNFLFDAGIGHSVVANSLILLDFLTPEQLEESIRALKSMEFNKIGVSHCTGMRAAFRLHQEFGDRFFYGCVGSVLEV